MGKVENIKQPKGMKIDLDRERHMRLTMAGLAYLAEKYGSVQEAFGKLSGLSESGELDRMTHGAMTLVTDVLFACLCHEDRVLTPEDVQGMVGMDDFADLFVVLGAVIGGSMPESKGTTGEGENP